MRVAFFQTGGCTFLIQVYRNTYPINNWFYVLQRKQSKREGILCKFFSILQSLFSPRDTRYLLYVDSEKGGFLNLTVPSFDELDRFF